MLGHKTHDKKNVTFPAAVGDPQVATQPSTYVHNYQTLHGQLAVWLLADCSNYHCRNGILDGIHYLFMQSLVIVNIRGRLCGYLRITHGCRKSYVFLVMYHMYHTL